MAVLDLALQHALYSIVRLTLAALGIVGFVLSSTSDACYTAVSVVQFGVLATSLLGFVVMFINLPLVLKVKEQSMANRFFLCKVSARFIAVAALAAIVGLAHLVFIGTGSYFASTSDCVNDDSHTLLIVLIIIAWAEIVVYVILFLYLSTQRTDVDTGKASSTPTNSQPTRGKAAPVLNPDDSEDMLRLEDPSQFVNTKRAALFISPPQPAKKSKKEDSSSESGSFVGGGKSSTGSEELTGSSSEPESKNPVIAKDSGSASSTSSSNRGNSDSSSGSGDETGSGSGSESGSGSGTSSSGSGSGSSIE